jgi:hypothetical protein
MELNQNLKQWKKKYKTEFKKMKITNVIKKKSYQLLPKKTPNLQNGKREGGV